MTSSAVAMKLLCITKIGTNSSEKILDVEKLLQKCQIVIIFVQIGQYSDFYNCYKGLVQGEALSPLIFSLFINDVETDLLQNNIQP